jgi:transcription elongation factor/antiterminator RfaH
VSLTAVMTVAGETEFVGRRWFALYTKPHKEYVVQGLLRSQDVETYLPEIAVAVRRRDRRDKRPFFPHYLFARLDPHGEQMPKVQWTPGLRRIVSAGGRPVPIPNEVVAHIRQRLETMVEEIALAPFEQGEIVRVTHGPFEGLDALFDRALSPDGRVRVLLELMGRLVAADLDLEDLL